MRTGELMKGLKYEVLRGTDETDVERISWDSRKVRRNTLFICVKGKNVDRHDFAPQAAQAGATVLVVEREVPGVPADVNVIKVDNTRAAMAHIAAAWYGEPSKYMNLIGITGTNGKTSVSWFVAKILEASGRKAGIIGTIENRTGSGRIKTEKLNPTTPDSIELQAALREMLDGGVSDVAMEVTSVALENHRVDQCRFDVGVFTNLTQDHLDEHGTMENYKNAKLKLFGLCKYGVVNADDPVCREIRETAACDLLLTYGVKNEADLKAENIEYTMNGVRFTLNFNNVKRSIFLKVPGKFSVYNILAAIGACHLSGLTLEQIARGVERIDGVKGRFEAVPNARDYLVVVDYAHTPDGLENVLTSIREFSKGKVIAVFGCGGDRDRSKRPQMGEIAGRLADFCILTSDNPRTEEPSGIIADIEKGILKTKCPYQKVVNRKDAIFRALKAAEPQDVVLIAGKGHENYQMFADKTIHFDDGEVVREYFEMAAIR